MMAEEGGDEIFIYTGGDQVVPNDVRRVRIDKFVTIIPRDAFYGREHLIMQNFMTESKKLRNMHLLAVSL
jgi:hypothetical protein